MLKKKVYIVDYDLISPIGIGRDSIIESIKSNSTSDQHVERVNTIGIPFKRAAEVRGDLSALYKDESESILNTIKFDRKLELLAACYGKMKGRMADLVSKMNPAKTGVILGIGADVTPFELFEESMAEYIYNDKNPIEELYTKINRNDSKLNITNNAYDFYSIYLANKFNAGAFQKSILTACVSSTQAIALGADSIRNGEAEVVVVGGTDSLLNLLAMVSFGKLGVIPESDENISCKPFDTNRNGALAGESAGIIILASEDFVLKNNLKPIAQFMGYGNTLDGYKITAPDPEGIAMTKAIKDAVDDAGITVDMIDYINAHGTGTRHNDCLELKSYEKALGPKAKTIPISSTKDRHGHAIAAAGVQEVCVLLELMKHNVLPKNLHLTNSCDPSFNLLKKNTFSEITYGISSNFAFGGINTVLIIKNERN